MNIFHRWLNPHCAECREEREETRVCNSCETLKMELERLRIENEKLLDRILERPQSEPIKPETTELKPVLPKNVPWNVRRQMLETEDREKAKILANRQKTDELEKEILDIKGASDAAVQTQGQ